ncbi:unnamed protein product [Dovyalis caffra]|uniref:Btz domain-containing protein n=1 Tax=Dovyalis caffra TaxID=77055 RepID=A0AAV1RB78_9ROSI|nr:unnamed protein product [Dovyalis caffra]
MSRRERDSDSRRHRSGFDRESSPKRSRRDGKPETERVTADSNLDQKNRRRLQDALPLEAPSGLDSVKVGSGGVIKETDKKPDGYSEGSKHSSNPTEVPRSRSYFQHDERGNAAQVGRSFGQRAATERRFRDSKDYRDDRAVNKSATYDSQQRDKKPRGKGDDNSAWGHDGFLKMEAEPPPPARKRPAFREKKIPVENENPGKAAVESARSRHSDHPMSVSERREERDRNPRHIDRSERQAAGNRELQRVGLPSRERYGGGGGNYRGRERFSERRGYHPSGTVGEKWKHDLFDDGNRSPTTKNDEDQIAKIEALLAS